MEVLSYIGHHRPLIRPDIANIFNVEERLFTISLCGLLNTKPECQSFPLPQMPIRSFDDGRFFEAYCTAEDLDDNGQLVRS